MKTHTAQIFRARLVVGLLTALSLTVASTGRATAQGVIRINSCPFVIVAPGQYLVTQDLFCPLNGIQIQSSNVRLNVGGHTITGSTIQQGIGIEVNNGQNVEIRNGTVTNFHDGIQLSSSSDCRIEAMTSTGNASGLEVLSSDDNTITSSELSNNHATGVRVAVGSGNVFRGNKVNGNLGTGYIFDLGPNNNNLITSSQASASIVTGNQSHGITMNSGDQNNTVQSSRVFGNILHGIAVAGDNNTVRSNTVNENGLAGIRLFLGANANTIMSNTATGNAIFDLEDDNPNCDANVWRQNNFNTANQPQCID